MPQPLWQTAASFAARAHAGQLRKDGLTPYVAHVFRVALTVRDRFECGDPIVLAAALLHDTIEDTRTDFEDIAEQFGLPVARCVSALTKNMALPEAEREREYDRRLARADWRARLIKLADVYDNLSDSADRTPAERRRHLARCRRALALAAADARTVPAIRRAIVVVEALVKKATSRSRRA